MLQLSLFFILTFIFQDPRSLFISEIQNTATACNNVRHKSQETELNGKTPALRDDNTNSTSVSVIVVASDQRSSSTFLSQDILGNMPCHLSLNEVLSQSKVQSGDAWNIEGQRNQMNNRRTNQLDPADLATFIRSVGERRCRTMLAETNQTDRCQNHCWVNYKHFPGHLDSWQHAILWQSLSQQVPLAMIILERNVKDRWRSIRYARESKDWNVQGSAEHKIKVEATDPGPIPERFKYNHEEWFRLV